MKRFFPIMISLMLLCSVVFTGCNSSNETTLSTKDVITNNYNLLIETYPEDVSFDSFSGTITELAKQNGIEVTESSDTYLVLSKESSGELKNVESFAFHTAVDFSDESCKDSSFQAAAAVMTIIMNAQNHGDLTAIFTSMIGGQAAGTDALKSEYIDSDNIIDVTYSKKSIMYNTFAASSNLTASKELTINDPAYTKAYNITFSGIENQSAYKNRGTYPNPIKTIGDLLASCQTSTILFELADFEGGNDPANIPSNVSAIIVLHENDVEAFTKKFNNSYEKVDKMYDDVSDEGITFEYTMTPVDLPSQVVCKEDTEKIVSLMYTMINGTYLRNEDDEVEAFSNIGTVSINDGSFKLNINAKSLNDELMTELEGVVNTICGLSNMKYEKISGTHVWTNPPESPLVTALSENLNLDPCAVLEMKQVSSLIEKDENINLVCWGTSVENAQKDIEKLFEYVSIAGLDLAENN